tara:strand:- start:1451 stop:2254 length:804 start_codon:yes stop_codon:yes gene_type:complete
MAFKMKNPSLMKMAKAAGNNRVAMKMKKDSPMDMGKKSAMKAEGKPSDTSKDNVKQAKDLVKEMKRQRKDSRKADTAANRAEQKAYRAEKSDARNLEIADKAIKKGEAREQKILAKGAKKIERRTGVTKAKRKTARNQAQTARVVGRTKRKDDRLIMKQQDTRDKAAKKVARLEEKISPMSMKKKSAMKLSEADKKKAMDNAMPAANVESMSKESMAGAKKYGFMKGGSFDMEKANRELKSLQNLSSPTDANYRRQAEIRKLMKAFS